jgi:hypothetical protein
MAVGEKSYDFRGMKTVKYENTPIPPGKYRAVLKGSEASIQKSNKNPDIPAWVTIPFEILDTAKSEGGKNRTLIHALWCSLKEGKDGAVSPQRGDGLFALAKALGEDPGTFDQQVNVAAGVDDEGNDIDVIDQRFVKEWLSEQDGKELGLVIKSRSYTGDGGTKVKTHSVDFFEEIEMSDDVFSGEEVEDAAEEEDAEAEEPEPTPPPKKAPLKKAVPAKTQAKRR